MGIGGDQAPSLSTKALPKSPSAMHDEGKEHEIATRPWLPLL
jgi:hypothetical protein